MFKNFDKAFFRRILYHIKYPLPTNKELVELWKFHLGNPNILERMKLASTKEIPKDIHNFSYAEIAEYSAGLTGKSITAEAIAMALGKMHNQQFELKCCK